MNKRQHQIIIGLILGFMAAYALTTGILTLHDMLNTSIKGWHAEPDDQRVVVTIVSPDGPAASLKVGDEVTALRSSSRTVPSSTTGIWPVPSGFAYVADIERDGAPLTIPLVTGDWPPSYRATRWLGYAIIPATFFLTAFILFAFKPHDPRVSVLVLLFSTFAYDCPAAANNLPLAVAIFLALGSIATSALTPLFFHFLLRFPDTSPWVRRFPRLQYLLYVPFILLIAAPSAFMEYQWIFHAAAYLSFYQSHPWLMKAFMGTQLLYVAAGLLALWSTYRRSNLASRRKVRVVFAGFLVGGLPLAAWNSIWSIAGVDSVPLLYVLRIEVIVYGLLLLLPVTLAYAVLRHQVIPFSLLIRRSARYLLASRGVVFLQTLIVFGLLSWWLNSRFFAAIEPWGNMARIAAEILVLLLGMVALRAIHRRVRPLIDRHFFRESYDMREIMAELGKNLSSMTQAVPLLELVTGRIQSTLHAENVHIFRQNELGTVLVSDGGMIHDSLEKSANGSPAAEGSGLPVDGYLAQLLSQATGPVIVDLTDEQSWVHARLPARSATGNGLIGEYETLKQIDSALLLPINIKGQLFAVISLGPRLGDLPYDEDDQQLLSSIAWLTSFAIENLKLFEREANNLEQLRQAQKMEAVGRLAGGIAHDFNNLLTVITGYSDLMLRKLEPNHELRPKVEEVKKAGERAAGLTRQLLAFSRKQILQPKIINLNDIVVDTFKMLQRLIGEDIDLLMVPESKIGKVKADPGQIEQVLMNLAVNARDAMPTGGKLTIKTANIRLDLGYTMQHVAVQPGDYVVVSVSDTGCGMDAATKERVFEPFFTTKELGKGTGLGLSTVYGIVKQSGGHLWVYSEPGQGTTFKIYLPREETAAEIAEAASEANPVITGTETVLLVEDERAVRQMTRQVLEELGYRVIEAESGPEAIRLIGLESDHINLLLTDVVMPKMSGHELAQRLTIGRPDLRVLYTSGYTEDAIVHHGVLESGVAFLEKPFTPERVARKVREVLDAVSV